MPLDAAEFRAGAINAGTLKIPEGDTLAVMAPKKKPPSKKSPKSPAAVRLPIAPSGPEVEPPRETFDLDNIDDLEAATAKPGRDQAEPEVPPQLVLHACRLPAILMKKEELAKYLQTHSVGQADRKKLDVSVKERELYEIYTRAKHMRRVPLAHFVAALRLWHGGFPIDPKDALKLDELVVKE